jgi:DNA-binding transcriptional LysR family regulator
MPPGREVDILGVAFIIEAGGEKPHHMHTRVAASDIGQSSFSSGSCFSFELGKLFKGLELKLYRGDIAEVLAYLKRGDAELGLAADLGDEWERLDSWPLFTEDFQIVVNSMHRLANATSVALGDLKEERFVLRTYCESTPMVLDFLRAQGINVERRHETGAESDLIALLEAGVGVALLPRSTKAPETLLRLMVEKLELSRTVYLYGVAGRQRTAVASTLMKMLRACDWSRYAA